MLNKNSYPNEVFNLPSSFLYMYNVSIIHNSMVSYMDFIRDLYVYTIIEYTCLYMSFNSR